MRKVKIFLIACLIIVFAFSGAMLSSCKKIETSAETTAAETAAATTATAATTAVVTAEETTAAETMEPVELILWGPQSENDPLIELYKAWSEHMKEKYNITIKVELKPWDSWSELLTTAGVSQTGPDIMWNTSGLSGSISAGQNQIAAKLNDLLPEGMYDAIAGWGGVTDSDGSIYAVPYEVESQAIAYNKDMFTKAGIDFSGFPRLWSWDEYTSVCDKLLAAGITPIAFANKEGYYGEWWLAGAMGSYFDTNLDMANYFKSESMNSQPMLDALAKYKMLYDKGYFLEDGLTLDFANNSKQEFMGEKVAMQLSEGTWYKEYVENMGAEKVGITNWPYFSSDGKLSKGKCGVFNQVFTISPWSQYKDKAMLALQELAATDWGASLVFDLAGETPTFKNYKYELSADANEWEKYLKFSQGLFSVAEASSYCYDLWTPEFSDAIYKFNPQFLAGDMTAEEFAEELDAARGIE